MTCLKESSKISSFALSPTNMARGRSVSSWRAPLSAAILVRERFYFLRCSVEPMIFPFSFGGCLVVPKKGSNHVVSPGSLNN